MLGDAKAIDLAIIAGAMQSNVGCGDRDLRLWYSMGDVLGRNVLEQRDLRMRLVQLKGVM